MPTLRRVLLPAALAATALVAASGVPVSAHNAAHMFINGQCLEVGSDKNGPLVGDGAPQDASGQLDLIYDPRNGIDTTDQYGARLAAVQGSTPLLPGDCPG